LHQRSDMKGSETDNLAWTFRMAFDKQLESKGQENASMPIERIVKQAISEGAPRYNKGDVTGCERVYLATTRQLLMAGNLGDKNRSVLQSALEQCQRSPDVDARAWILRKTLDSLLGQQDMEPHRWASEGSAQGIGGVNQILCDFTGTSGLDMSTSVVNDTVMGGRSESSVRFDARGAIFEGVVTRRGGGGFASVRFTPSDRRAFTQMLSAGSGLSIVVERLRGSVVWKFQLNESRGFFSFVSTNWQADFNTREADTRVTIPFSSLIPTKYGKPEGGPGLPRDTVENIESFGFMLSFLNANGSDNSSFQEGPFGLIIKAVTIS